MASLFTALNQFHYGQDSNSNLEVRLIEKNGIPQSEIAFCMEDEGLSAVLTSDDRLFLQMSKNGVLGSYEISSDQKIQAQLIKIQENSASLCFLMDDVKQEWNQAKLIANEKQITWFAIASPSDDPDTSIQFRTSVEDEDSVCRIAFNKKLYRWTDAYESYDNSYLVSEIMTKSKGIIREDMTTEIVCEMFQITKEQLEEIPALLIAKSKKSPQMK